MIKSKENKKYKQIHMNTENTKIQKYRFKYKLFILNKMSEFKIIYYNCRGRSEVTRIILEFAGKSYEEEYVDDKWPEYKKKLTESGEIAFGQVPLLKHNGKNICQSCAILRYVGRLYI